MYVFMYPPHWLEAGVDCGHLSNRFSYLVVVGVCWETPDCVHQAVVKRGECSPGEEGRGDPLEASLHLLVRSCPSSPFRAVCELSICEV